MYDQAPPLPPREIVPQTPILARKTYASPMSFVGATNASSPGPTSLAPPASPSQYGRPSSSAWSSYGRSSRAGMS